MHEKPTTQEQAEAFQALVHERQRVLLGARYVGVSLSEIRLPERDQLKIMKFMNKPRNFLVYCGGPGIGKTHFCGALFSWAIKKFYLNWRYWTENSMLKQLRKSMDQFNSDYLDTLKFMIDDAFMILDDVGSSVKGTEWREEVLFAALDQRYNSMLPTVITSNFLQKEFLEKYHPRIHSRLFSKDNTIIEIEDGVDFRLQELSNLKNKFEDYKG